MSSGRSSASSSSSMSMISGGCQAWSGHRRWELAARSARAGRWSRSSAHREGGRERVCRDRDFHQSARRSRRTRPTTPRVAPGLDRRSFASEAAELPGGRVGGGSLPHRDPRAPRSRGAGREEYAFFRLQIRRARIPPHGGVHSVTKARSASAVDPRSVPPFLDGSQRRRRRLTTLSAAPRRLTRTPPAAVAATKSQVCHRILARRAMSSCTRFELTCAPAAREQMLV